MRSIFYSFSFPGLAFLSLLLDFTMQLLCSVWQLLIHYSKSKSSVLPLIHNYLFFYVCSIIIFSSNLFPIMYKLGMYISPCLYDFYFFWCTFFKYLGIIRQYKCTYKWSFLFLTYNEVYSYNFNMNLHIFRTISD